MTRSEAGTCALCRAELEEAFYIVRATIGLLRIPDHPSAPIPIGNKAIAFSPGTPASRGARRPAGAKPDIYIAGDHERALVVETWACLACVQRDASLRRLVQDENGPLALMLKPEDDVGVEKVARVRLRDEARDGPRKKGGATMSPNDPMKGRGPFFTIDAQQANREGTKCRYCPTLVFWAEMPSGKKMPLDLAIAEALPDGKLKCVSHFATCPAADRVRLKKEHERKAARREKGDWPFA